MPAGEVEEKEVWFDESQDRMAFLSLIITSKESVFGTRTIDVLEDRIKSVVRIHQMHSKSEHWVTFITRIPHFHQLFGIIKEHHVSFKAMSMETLERNL